MSNRVFDEAFLASAGELSIVRLQRALEDSNLQEASRQLHALQAEVMGMYFSYDGWERTLLKTVEQLDDAGLAQSMLDSVLDVTIAPERILPEGILPRWAGEFKVLGSVEPANLLQGAQQLFGEAQGVHDGMMSRVAALMSLFQQRYGDEKTTVLLQKVMNPAMLDPDGTLPFREKALKLIEYTRYHLVAFRVWEDDQRITFKPSICPSGGRLAQEGHYDSPREGLVLQGARPLTYGRESLPVYCCHESAMEIAGIEQYGAAVFVVEPGAEIGYDQCQIHLYKNKADIPERFYQRFGLSRPDLIASA